MRKGFIKMSEKGIEIKGLTKFQVMKILGVSMEMLIKEDVITKDDFETISKVVLSTPEELEKMLKNQHKEFEEKIKKIIKEMIE